MPQQLETDEGRRRSPQPRLQQLALFTLAAVAEVVVVKLVLLLLEVAAEVVKRGLSAALTGLRTN